MGTGTSADQDRRVSCPRPHHGLGWPEQGRNGDPVKHRVWLAFAVILVLAATAFFVVRSAEDKVTDSGYLSLEVEAGADNARIAKIVKAGPVMVGGGKGSMAMQPPFPQCPSAWAVLWAWWGTNAAFCGALGFFGPMAALGCPAAMAIAGSAIDFNRGC